MGIFKKFLSFFARSPTEGVARHQLVVERGNGFYSWNGVIYKSDIIQSCVNPFARAVGKLKAKQVRSSGEDIKINPDAYVRVLLDEPNALMSGQMLQQKLAVQLALNNNAFALILRDDNGYATEIYPITASSVEAVYDKDCRLFLRFCLQSGATATFPYSDIIHIRDHFYKNDIFGDSNIEPLKDIMEVVGTIDRSLVAAVRNGAVIKWLLKWKQTLRNEDIKTQTEAFARAYLSTENDGLGVAGVDAKADIEQVAPHDYVPNAVQWDKSISRLYYFFGTNEKIISSTYTEDEWNAYYESVVEPVSIQLANEYTRKIFSRRERGYGNRIVFESMSLQYASMQTKLNLLQMVDRGALTPNEWREVMNMGPIEGGNKPVRRLDTAVITDRKEGELV